MEHSSLRRLTLRSKSGGIANVGYDRLNRKRFDTMAGSRLRHRGGIRTARNHDARATRQGEDVRSKRSESKAGAVFDGRDKTQARQGAGRPRVSKGVAGDEALRRGLSMNGERALA